MGLFITKIAHFLTQRMEIYALTQNVIFPPPWFMGVGDYIKFDTTALHSNMKKVTTDLFRFVRDLVKVKLAETPPKS